MRIPRITFNAPANLVLFGVALIVMFVSVATGGNAVNYLAAIGPPQLSLRYILGLFTYPLAHGDWLHFVGNFSVILLVGPILEEKYGSRFLAFSFLITTVLIGLIHTVFFSGGIIGASGWVFFCIVLVSMTNFQRGEIPMTLLLVAFIYLGKEIVGLYQQDQISQLGHILGGLCGGSVGYVLAASGYKRSAD